MRMILNFDQSRPGICTEAGLAQAQFNLSQLLVVRSGVSTTNEAAPGLANADSSSHLEEAAILAQRARKVLMKPQPLEPLSRKIGNDQQGPDGREPSLTAGQHGIPLENELALFDHLQPVFDGRFTGLHLLQYLRDTASPNSGDSVAA